MPALRISVGLVVKPLMSGLRLNSAMTFKSAPSANIFTVKSANALMRCFLVWPSPSSYSCFILQDNPTGFKQRTCHKIRLVWSSLRVAVVHQNGLAAGGFACGNVAPPVADHERARQINGPDLGCGQQHARLGFAAIALIGLLVVTNLEVIKGKPGAQLLVHLLDHLAAQPPGAH